MQMEPPAPPPPFEGSQVTGQSYKQPCVALDGSHVLVKVVPYTKDIA